MTSRCQRGLASKLRGIVGVLVADLLAGHFDVAAEQNRKREGRSEKERGNEDYSREHVVGATGAESKG